MVTTRRNVTDEVLPPTGVEGGEPSRQPPQDVPEMMEDYDEYAEYDGEDDDADQGYYEEEYPQPMEAEETPEVVVLREEVATQQQKIDAQQGNIAAL